MFLNTETTKHRTKNNFLGEWTHNRYNLDPHCFLNLQAVCFNILLKMHFLLNFKKGAFWVVYKELQILGISPVKKKAKITGYPIELYIDRQRSHPETIFLE